MSARLRTLRPGLVSAALSLLLAAGAFGAPGAHAQNATVNPAANQTADQGADDQAPPRLLTITGTGQASAQPDIAYISTGVVTQAAKADEALSANTKAMNALFDGVQKLGIPKEDLQTSQFSVSPVYDQPKDSNQPPTIRAYQVTNQLNVTIHKLGAVGGILDKLVGLGSNRVDNITFAIEKPEPVLDLARKAAVENALHKAKLYADAAGVALGPILSISEGGGMVTPPRPLMRMAAADSAPVPVAAGQQTLTADVTVVIALR